MFVDIHYGGGGAVYGSATFISCTVSGCYGGYDGGAVDGGNVVMVDSIVTGCGSGS